VDHENDMILPIIPSLVHVTESPHSTSIAAFLDVYEKPIVVADIGHQSSVEIDAMSENSCQGYSKRSTSANI
jgi:hypothetical protein